MKNTTLWVDERLNRFRSTIRTLLTKYSSSCSFFSVIDAIEEGLTPCESPTMLICLNRILFQAAAERGSARGLNSVRFARGEQRNSLCCRRHFFGEPRFWRLPSSSAALFLGGSLQCWIYFSCRPKNSKRSEATWSRWRVKAKKTRSREDREDSLRLQFVLRPTFRDLNGASASQLQSEAFPLG